MRKICVVTGSRAEYGLLYWLMREIDEDKDLILQVVVTGTHLEPRYGLTYKQIVKDGFKINAKVNLSLKSDKDEAIARSAGIGVINFAKVYKKLKPDIVVLLGDRFETLAAATSAVLVRISIAHIHGGEITEGAYDDSIRHAITKMAYLHFVSHEEYARRVVQMGENPKRVVNFGAPGIDNIKRLKLLSKEQLERELAFKLGRDVAIVTFHPATMERGAASRQIKNLLKALDKSGLRMIFTMPNADAENKVIFQEIERYAGRNPARARIFRSLGQLKYLSLLKHVSLMIGNSSSGIIETPSFKLPVVNVGNRQKGRIQAGNVINVSDQTESILKGIKRAISPGFRRKMESIKNPFGDGQASVRIVKKLKAVELDKLDKGFYDLK